MTENSERINLSIDIIPLGQIEVTPVTFGAGNTIHTLLELTMVEDQGGETPTLKITTDGPQETSEGVEELAGFFESVAEALRLPEFRELVAQKVREGTGK